MFPEPKRLVAQGTVNHLLARQNVLASDKPAQQRNCCDENGKREQVTDFHVCCFRIEFRKVGAAQPG